MDTDQKLILTKARRIASQNLRQCYKDDKVLASLKNFSDYWARDTFWAFSGILANGDQKIARSSLEYFLKLQKPNGAIPRKIALDYNGLKYITGNSVKRKNPKPVYTGLIPPFSSMDQNALLVISFEKYLTHTSNLSFGRHYYHQIKRVLQWYESHMVSGLVYEYALGNWMDTIFKTGEVLYTNTLYAKSLESFCSVARALKKPEDQEIYQKKSADFKEKLRKNFWNGSFFDDQKGIRRHFDVAGNVVACYFNIATKAESKKIIQRLLRLSENHQLLPTVSPPYPFWKVNPLTCLLGMQDYHNGISWLWIDLFAVAAMRQNGFQKEALRAFENICKIIVRRDAVYETYFPDGRPFEARLWKSAVPFAWNIGVFLEVYEIIFPSK